MDPAAPTIIPAHGNPALIGDPVAVIKAAEQAFRDIQAQVAALTGTVTDLTTKLASLQTGDNPAQDELDAVTNELANLQAITSATVAPATNTPAPAVQAPQQPVPVLGSTDPAINPNAAPIPGQDQSPANPNGTPAPSTIPGASAPSTDSPSTDTPPADDTPAGQ